MVAELPVRCPKGALSLARGWAEERRTYPGIEVVGGINPKGVVFRRWARHRDAIPGGVTQPRWGWNRVVRMFPGVVSQATQPRANDGIPLG